MGVLGCDSATRASALWANAAVTPGCGFAHRDVVTARQQSWLQQLVLWKASWSEAAADVAIDVAIEEPWH